MHRAAPTCWSWGPARRGRRPRPGRRGPVSTWCSRTRRCSRATRPAATGSPRGRSVSSSASGSRTGCARTRSTRACGRTASARRCSCRGRAARCPTGARRWPGPSCDDHLRTTAIKAGAAARRRGAGRRRTPRGRPRRRGRVQDRRRAPRDRVPPPGRGRRGPLAARQGARPGVAPGHRLRRGRPLLHRVGDVRRPVDQLAPRAPGPGRQGPVRLRLDLPARQRRGEHRRRHAGDQQAARGPGGQAADGALRRAAPRGVPALRRAADADVGTAADGRRGEQRRGPQLGPDRRRGRLREPAQR